MKCGLFAFIALSTFTGSLVGCTGESGRATRKAVVVANGRSLSVKDFADELAIKLRKYDAVLAKNPLNVSRVKDEVINDFVHKSVLMTWAEKNNVQITPDEINAFAAKAQSSYPDELAFREALAKGHRSYSEWKESLRTHVLEKKLFSELNKKIEPPGDSEMEIFFKSNEKQFQKGPQVRIRQIVVEKEEDAVRLHKELVAKTPFVDLAKKYSIAPEGKEGGELGWVERGTLEVFDRVFNLPKGALSGVLKSPYGFHLIEVLEKKPEAKPVFSDVKSKIKDLLVADRQQAVYAAWLEEQMKSAKVSRDNDLLRSITVDTKQE